MDQLFDDFRASMLETILGISGEFIDATYKCCKIQIWSSFYHLTCCLILALLSVSRAATLIVEIVYLCPHVFFRLLPDSFLEFFLFLPPPTLREDAVVLGVHSGEKF